MVVLIFIITIFFTGFSEENSENLMENQLCLSKNCLHKGLEIFSSLNTSENPCSNFYEFACGNWKMISSSDDANSEIFWNQWTKQEHLIRKRLLDILEKYRGSNKNFLKIFNLYESCINRDKHQDIYLNELQILIEKIGGWQNVVSSKLENNKGGFYWLSKISHVSRLLGVHPLLKISVVMDLENTSQYILQLEPGDLSVPSWILENPLNYLEEINYYHNWLYKTMAQILPNINEKDLQVQAIHLVQFEIEIARLLTTKQKTVRISLKKLKRKFPKTQWNTMFKTMLHNRGLKLNSSTLVQVRKVNYVEKLQQILNETSPEIVGNYIIWTIAREFSRDVTKNLRYLNFLINKDIYKIKSDISYEKECIDLISNYFGDILMPKYVSEYFDSKYVVDVKYIFERVQNQFLKKLQNNSWLNFATKLEAIEKVKNMKVVVGLAPQNNNSKILDTFYDEINITENYLLNVINLRTFKAKKNLEKLNTSVDKIQLPDNLIQTNAYYNILQNSIIIPLGLMEPPFYYGNISRVLNFGATGSLIGHEMAHSLDWNGRHFDSTGKMIKWWKTSDIENYDKKLECFRTFYNISEREWSISAEENIADFTGLVLSWNEFQNELQYGEFSSIPYLENFTKEQLFFISYAQMWCENEGRKNFEGDDHLPVTQRINSVLRNFDSFHKTFNCSTSKNVCHLW